MRPQRKIKARKQFLRAIDVFVYAELLIGFVAYIALDFERRFVISLMWFRDSNVVLFTLISTSAMLYIQRSSTQLKDLGIHSRSLVMTIYMTILVLISILAPSTSFIQH